MPDSRKNVIVRAVLFSLASNAAVLFVLKFGQIVWPEGLPAHSQNAFWIASGVNVAGLLLLGLGYWPVIILNAFPAWWLAGEPLDLTLPGSLTNALEALLAAWMVRKFGAFGGRFDNARAVGLLLVASLVAPLINTVVIPAWFCVRGIVPWTDYPDALGNWNLANGGAMLMVAPFLVAIAHGNWSRRDRGRELALFAVGASVVCLLAFNALFDSSRVNITFLAFPVVIYAAVRFGASEVAAVLGLALAAIYASLATHAHAIPPAQMASAIWFAQAFCWVLAATGLLVSALVFERRSAKHETRLERERTLEISLSEERARLEALRYQLSPHFLFNSLNSIYSTLPVEGTEVPRKMLTELAGYLRSTLVVHEHDSIPLREEIRSMEQYLAIERNRFGDDLQVMTTVEETAQEIEIPAFLLQPLVENAIVHGFAVTKDIFRLEIRATVRNSKLEIEVANTGTWKAGSNEGVGLTSTRRRLELLFGDEATFRLENTDGWVRVRLGLPIEKDHPPCAA